MFVGIDNCLSELNHWGSLGDQVGYAHIWTQLSSLVLVAKLEVGSDKQ